MTEEKEKPNRDVGKWTIGDIVRNMRPGQLRAFVISLAALIVGAWWVGVWLGDHPLDFLRKSKPRVEDHATVPRDPTETVEPADLVSGSASIADCRGDRSVEERASSEAVQNLYAPFLATGASQPSHALLQGGNYGPAGSLRGPVTWSNLSRHGAIDDFNAFLALFTDTSNDRGHHPRPRTDAEEQHLQCLHEQFRELASTWKRMGLFDGYHE